MPALGLTLSVLLMVWATPAQAWRSTLYPVDWAPPGVTSANFETNKVISDFSYAGYQAGEQPLPTVAGPLFNVTQPPYNANNTGASDATLAIQSAINAAQAAGGGVVFLPAGLYAVSPQGANSYALTITASNVVLRGAGVGTTFLLNTSTNMRSKSIILINGPSAAGFFSSGAGSTTITQDLLGPATEIPVTSTSGFAVGQSVMVRADCTDAWITEHNEPGWIGFGSNLRGVAYFRRVVAISPTTVTINAPTRYYLKTRDNARVVRLSSGPLRNCGLEDFSIGNVQHNSTTGWGEEDYTVTTNAAYVVHDSFAVRMVRARDSWIRNLATFQPAGNTTTCHLLSNGILLNECSQITLTNCHFQRPQFGGGGGNGYMYRLQNVNEVLLDNCRATFSRHGFVLSHMGSSGNVFHECIDKDTGRQTGSSGSQSTSGSNSDHHMHFSHANLVDACTGDGSSWEARYRPYGSAPLHNLTAAHSVYWNMRGIGSGGQVVITEQSRYGYVIGTRGTRTGVSLSSYGGTKCNPADHVEGTALGDTLEPFSLYTDQLNRRLSLPHVSLPASLVLGFPTNSVRLQPTVQIGSELASSNDFTAQWRVLSSAGAILFSSTNAVEPLLTFAARGTNEVEVAVTANGHQTTARTTIFLAPVDATVSESFEPVADTFVRDGSFTNDNYGQDTTLLLKKEVSTGFNRRAFLRFNLASATMTSFDRAILELRSPSPPAPGSAPTLELRFITNDVWLETVVNWNNQPAVGQMLATWPMSTNGPDRVDISSIVASEMSGDDLFSLGLLIANPFSATVYSFHSREATEALRPRLVLEITNAALSFNAWIAGFTNLPPSATNPNDDPDGDGDSNAEEYLFAHNPSQADPTGLAVTHSSQGIVLTFPQRKRLPIGSYYVIESAHSLFAATWQPAPGMEFANLGEFSETILMSATVPSNGAAQTFYRLRIVLAP